MRCCKEENFIKVSGRKYKCSVCNTTWYRDDRKTDIVKWINANNAHPSELLHLIK